MPADLRTGIESRIVLSHLREVKTTYGVDGFAGDASARLVSVT
jgi:hypothetical protein